MKDSKDSAVTLIGLMGAGKTKVGLRAAERVGRGFVDTDAMVEQAAGRSVAAIFADDGEQRFRALERAAIASALECGNVVVSVGGGAVLDADNVTRMRAAGVVVWLYADPVTLATRLTKSAARGDRPLLDGSDRTAVLAELLDARRDAYTAAATATLRTDGMTVDESAVLLATWIRAHS